MHLLLSICAVILVLGYIFGPRAVGGVLIILAVLAAIIIARAPGLAPDPPEPLRILDQACADDFYKSWDRSSPSVVAEVEILCSKPVLDPDCVARNRRSRDPIEIENICGKPVTSVVPAGSRQRLSPAAGG